VNRPALVAVLAVAVAGCGKGKPSLVVSAAASLKTPFTRYATQFSQANVRYSFAGSDMLAAQIEQGAKPDVFVSANTTLPAMLYAKAFVRRPVTFAANKLVIAVPAASTKVRSIGDLERSGATIAIGSPTVPIGSYTRKVLAKLGAARRAKIMANVRSEEPDVSGIVGKLTQGAVDAGFTYVTYVRATKGALRAIPLPASLQPVVAYAAAVVKGVPHPRQAQAFIAGLFNRAGQADLTTAGFLPPPGK
jgi:molybdate transport system substrate-binding protein